MTYTEKLLDPRWQKKRLKILERDDFTCQSCHDNTNTLHIHHLDYEKGNDPWDYHNEWLLTLCKDCHSELTEQSKIHESLILRHFRLQNTTTFNMKCVSDVFSKYRDLSGLFYLLWETLEYQEEVDTALGELCNKKTLELLISKSILTDVKCRSCGDKMYKLKDFLLVCKTCGCKNPVDK